LTRFSGDLFSGHALEITRYFEHLQRISADYRQEGARLTMWWECSECGDCVERSRAPAGCRNCGTAGVIFVPAEVGDALGGEPEADSLRSVWLRAGFEQSRSTLAA
jgi:hypothetical protein